MGGHFLSTIISLMIVLPNIDIIIHLFQKPNKTWYHIKEYLLKDYIVTSIIVVFFYCFIKHNNRGNFSLAYICL